MKAIILLCLMLLLLPSFASAQVVQTGNGLVEGITLESGVHLFKGLPYAAPPVRDLRWKPPQPAGDWAGVRRADRFGPQCMQKPIFSDMMFRSEGTSEDCLYLNVWTPDVAPDEKLPVLAYLYGGGFVAGDGSEFRYDGAHMAEKGIVVVTVNYRLGIFGFFSHPALTAESRHGASGNYGLLDQAASLRWVQDNIEAFGGDAERVTIAGESAGSFSVSALMASPRSRDLIAGAIGESGSLLGFRAPPSLAESERDGKQFAAGIEALSLADLRALSATRLLELASRPGAPRFSANVDGYFFPKPPLDIYAAGEQAHVPLLAGWNSEEMSYRALLGPNELTQERFAAAVRRRFGDQAEQVLALYQGPTQEALAQAATDLAGDQFTGYSTWKWLDVHRQTGRAPVYRYYYAHPRPPMRTDVGEATPDQANRPPTGAVHSAEIEYAMGNLDTNPVYAWTEDDYKVSEIMQSFFANFVKTGDPNGPGLPIWPVIGDDPTMVMRIDVDPQAAASTHRDRYLLLDQIAVPQAMSPTRDD